MLFLWIESRPLCFPPLCFLPAPGRSSVPMTVVFTENNVVGAAAGLLEGRGDDAVNAVGSGDMEDARILVFACRIDVVVFGQYLALGVLQTQVGVELVTMHVNDGGFAGGQLDFMDHLGGRVSQLAGQLGFGLFARRLEKVCEPAFRVGQPSL